MTTIVGIEHGGNVWIGGDSGISVGGIVTKVPGKVFRVRRDNGEAIIFGCAGYGRMANLLHHGLKVPEHDRWTSSMAYLEINLVQAMRELFAANGYVPEGNDNEKPSWALNGGLLIGYRGKLYRVLNNFNVVRNNVGFASIGTGEEVAMGFCAATVGGEPKERIVGALETAEMFTNGTQRPWTILCGLGREPWFDEKVDIDPWKGI